MIDVEKWKQTSISALKEVNFNLLSLTRSVICDYHTKVEEILVKIICKSHGNDINFVIFSKKKIVWSNLTLFFCEILFSDNRPQFLTLHKENLWNAIDVYDLSFPFNFDIMKVNYALYSVIFVSALHLYLLYCGL